MLNVRAPSHAVRTVVNFSVLKPFVAPLLTPTVTLPRSARAPVEVVLMTSLMQLETVALGDLVSVVSVVLLTTPVSPLGMMKLVTEQQLKLQ